MAAKKNKSNNPKTLMAAAPRISFEQKAWIIILLIALCLAVFAQVTTFKFVNYDDNIYVASNPHIADGLSLKGIKWAFSADLLFDSPHADYWQPLTILSRMLDVELWNFNPGGHHFTNLFLHTANVILVFLLFAGMTHALWPSAWLAAAFAIHPLQVDSVAWVTERKDVLSTFWALAAFWNYWKYTLKKSLAKYLASIFFFTCALMSKPALVLFPFLLLLLDYWPLKRRERPESPETWRRLLIEKIPFALLASGAVCITLFTHSGTMRTAVNILKNFHSPIFYLKYLRDTIYPVNLVAVYPEKIYPFDLIMTASIAALILITAGAVWCARRYPYIFTGWFWFVLALAPAVSLEYTSRFMYTPILGLLIIAAWGIPDFFEAKKFPLRRLGFFSLILTLILAGYSYKQTTYWKDGMTLCQHILQVTGDNSSAENGLGAALFQSGRIEESEIHFRRSILLNPAEIRAHNNLALFLLRKGRIEEAEASSRKAMALNPEFIPAYHSLAIVLAVKGEIQQAIEVLNAALRIAPNDQLAHSSLGKAYAQTGEKEQAIAHFNKALEINPRDAETLNELAVLLIESKLYDEAIALFRRALHFKTGDMNIMNNLQKAQKEKLQSEMQPALGSKRE